jgi:hypothetical protein
MRAFFTLCTAATVVIGASCAPGHSRGAITRPEAPDVATFVTSRELSRMAGTLLDALRRTRPLMLGSRGTPTFVSVDGAPPADLSVLSTIPASIVREVRLLRASSNAGRVVLSADGRAITGDIIAVSTREATVWPSSR